jgi:hypothetical protein
MWTCGSATAGSAATPLSWQTSAGEIDISVCELWEKRGEKAPRGGRPEPAGVPAAETALPRAETAPKLIGPSALHCTGVPPPRPVAACPPVVRG